MIIFMQSKHGNEVVYIVLSMVLGRPASITADSSAWRHLHLSSSWPCETFALHLAQPPSLQFRCLNGVPLYPVETILKSLTMIAPFPRFIQFDLCAANSANFMKYVSHEGLTSSLEAKSKEERSLWNSSRVPALWNLLLMKCWWSSSVLYSEYYFLLKLILSSKSMKLSIVYSF